MWPFQIGSGREIRIDGLMDEESIGCHWKILEGLQKAIIF
jgi:hypothetical protein